MSDSTPVAARASDAEKSTRGSGSEDDAEHTAKKQRPSPPTFSWVFHPERQGKKPTEFSVHKEVACSHSPILKAAFDLLPSEEQCQVYKLPHVDKDTARLLLQYLYTKELLVKQLGDGAQPEETCDEETHALVKLWILAEELQMPQLQNKALEVIEKVGEKSKCAATASFPMIYDKTKEGSALRRYIVAACYYYLKGQTYKDFKEHFPLGMLLDFAMFASVDSKEGSDFDLSKYFVAVEEE